MGNMYDAVVIGAGPGGYVCAIKMAHLGLKVAVVEKEHAGGTCTNKGCIPTKALLTSAHFYHELKVKANQFGIEIKDFQLNFQKMKKHMEKAIVTSRKGVEYLFKKNGIDYIKGVGYVKNSNEVEVDDKVLQTKNVVIATGSKPVLFAPFDSVEGIWTSDEVFKMEKLPESITVIGGGVVGIEMATFFAFLGVKVYVIEVMDHILPSEDKDIVDVVRKELKKLGIKIFEKSKVKDLDKKKGNYVISVESPQESFDIESEKVLVSVGRKPNLGEDILDLGIKVEKGILTDEKLRTNIDNIYAIGDVRGKIMLAHVAFHEGIVAAENIAGEEKIVDEKIVPNVIFSYPEVASVGIREKEAEDENVKVAKFPFAANGRANTMNEKLGFVKVIYDEKNGKILGIGAVGPMATELVMEGAVAIKEGLTVDKLARIIHPHPTLSETLLGAFEEAEGKAIHL